MNEPAPLDLDRIRREIDAEVRARRAAGDYPPGFEREMDALFARFAPPAASGDFDAVLDLAEEAAALDPVIPTASDKLAGGLVKRLLGRLLGWYHAFVVQQVGTFAGATVRALRLLGRRVRALEEATGHQARACEEGAGLDSPRDDSVWCEVAVEALAGLTGRVLVGECGEGVLLAALTAAGIDAYGVEHRAAAAERAEARGLEVRVDDVPGHLRSIGMRELGAAVLAGCTERLPLGELLEVADLAASRLAPGGVLVLLSAAPGSWGRERTAVEADLSPGHPLHAQTWTRVLSERGFAGVTIFEEAGRARLDDLPGSDAAAAIHNANLARISAALFGPASYALVAVRSSGL